MLELQRSSVLIGDGIRQSISNQPPKFNAWFSSTVQFIFAGNTPRGCDYLVLSPTFRTETLISVYFQPTHR